MKTENYYSSNEILKGNGVKGKGKTKGIGTKIMMYIVLVFAFLFVGVFSNNQKAEAATCARLGSTSGTAYSTVQAAINAAGTSSWKQIYLASSCTESITVASNQYIILYMNGYNLTASSSTSFTITNNGKLHIYP